VPERFSVARRHPEGLLASSDCHCYVVTMRAWLDKTLAAEKAK
jgi:hypothetical protein